MKQFASFHHPILRDTGVPEERRNWLKGSLLTFLLLLPLLSWVIAGAAGQVEPKLYVDPSVVTVSPGRAFTVGIKVSNVRSLYTYQFMLNWDPSLLNVTIVTEQPFLNQEGSYKTSFNARIYNTPDPFGISGYIFVACTLLGEPATAAASGDGTLATIEFFVKEEGATSLHLYETKLINSMLIEMEHGTEDGYYYYYTDSQQPSAFGVVVDPSIIVDASLLPGNTFSVNMSVIQAVDLYAWSLNLSWDPALLSLSDVEEGSFLNQGTYNTALNTQTNQEVGRLFANCSLVGEPAEVSASGNGTLITVLFFVEGIGIACLDLDDTKLLDFNGIKVIHAKEDGYFVNAYKDASILSVEASPSIVKAGDSISITVVAKNEGNIVEDFDVTVYGGNNNLGTLRTSDLDPGEEQTLTFNWNTEGIAEGTYTIKAEASTMLWETDANDNNYVNGSVTITPPEQQFPLMQMLVISAVIGVAVVTLILLRKKR